MKKKQEREKLINSQWYKNGGAVVPDSGIAVLVYNGSYRICMEGDIQPSDLYWTPIGSLGKEL